MRLVPEGPPLLPPSSWKVLSPYFMFPFSPAPPALFNWFPPPARKAASPWIWLKVPQEIFPPSLPPAPERIYEQGLIREERFPAVAGFRDKRPFLRVVPFYP